MVCLHLGSAKSHIKLKYKLWVLEKTSNQDGSFAYQNSVF